MLVELAKRYFKSARKTWKKTRRHKIQKSDEDRSSVALLKFEDKGRGKSRAVVDLE